ncbi:unnamed protein product [Ceutorhynchus assimilis]|uniref:FYVE-type domain-containing protein n=1 Tax=Ceutorhynchus assimilis TaxID=467358 RepID=A0A9N9MHM7_9CUCU|nr:unnamed protein product [Ceutorhynchus assimilis]
MSCNHCNDKFGFFNKELGCANCGLSLCGKCLPHKWQSLGKICRTCYPKLLQNDPKTEPTFSPPDRFLKRLEKPLITIYKSNCSNIDLQLAKRLEKLKETPKISDSEIRQRLAKLKEGRSLNNTESATKTSKSEQEQVDALLEQLSSEPKLEENRSESPELPWCVLCNSDAEFRCLDCGGDLYCGQCNAEGHKEWGETGHKAEPYERTK